MRLRIVGRRADVRPLRDANEFLESPGDELRTVVRNNARTGEGVFLLRALQREFDVRLQHLGPECPMHDDAAVSVEHHAEIEERPGDPEVRDVHMPVLVRPERLLNAQPLLRRDMIPLAQHTRVAEHAVRGRRTHRHDVGIEHHVREPTIALDGMGGLVGEDRFLFCRRQPVIARHPGIVLVHLAVAPAPIVALAGPDPRPPNEPVGGDLGPLAPTAGRSR